MALGRNPFARRARRGVFISEKEMRKALERRALRRDYTDGEQFGESIGIINSYGDPIGKKVCIRSLRRANRQWFKKWQDYADDSKLVLQVKNSSNRISRSVRQINRSINRSR